MQLSGPTLYSIFVDALKIAGQHEQHTLTFSALQVTLNSKFRILLNRRTIYDSRDRLSLGGVMAPCTIRVRFSYSIFQNDFLLLSFDISFVVKVKTNNENLSNWIQRCFACCKFGVSGVELHYIMYCVLEQRTNKSKTNKNNRKKVNEK